MKQVLVLHETGPVLHETGPVLHETGPVLHEIRPVSCEKGLMLPNTTLVELDRCSLTSKCGLGRSIAVLPELEDRVRTVRALDYIPRAVGWAEDADISL